MLLYDERERMRRVVGLLYIDKKSDDRQTERLYTICPSALFMIGRRKKREKKKRILPRHTMTIEAE
jgi:hypothetical protein